MPTVHDKPLPTSVGIELEVNNLGNASDDQRKIRARFQVEGLDWVVKGDGSCGTGSSGGVEVNSPVIRTVNGLRQLIRVCALMRRLGFRTNSRCGLHVHVDVQSLTPEQRGRFTRFFIRWENAFYSLDPERRNSVYCLPLEGDIIRKLSAGGSWDSWTCRYRWINGCAYERHGTCEFRLMEGSLDEEHVLGWVSFLLYVYDKTVNGQLDGTYEKETGEPYALFSRMVEAIGFDNTPRARAAREWARKRYASVQLNDEIAAIRARRRELLRKAYNGEGTFVPQFVPAQSTCGDVSIVADSVA